MCDRVWIGEMVTSRRQRLLTFFELFEQHVQRGVFEHEIARVLVELAQSFQQGVIVRVDQRQVFDVQHCNDILAIALVHRYS